MAEEDGKSCGYATHPTLTLFLSFFVVVIGGIIMCVSARVISSSYIRPILLLSFRIVCRRRQIVLMTLSRTICRGLVCVRVVLVAFEKSACVCMCFRRCQMLKCASRARDRAHIHTYRISMVKR